MNVRKKSVTVGCAVVEAQAPLSDKALPLTAFIKGRLLLASPHTNPKSYSLPQDPGLWKGTDWCPICSE